jgi:hypothetical protein
MDNPNLPDRKGITKKVTRGISIKPQDYEIIEKALLIAKLNRQSFSSYTMSLIEKDVQKKWKQIEEERLRKGDGVMRIRTPNIHVVDGE